MSDDRLDYYRAASQAYRTACTAYRSREIDDETFLAYRDGWTASQREFDAEMAAEVRDTLASTLDIYRVDADADTGEWIGVPMRTGETAIYSAWNERTDTDTEHYDTHEYDSETRAVIVRWVEDREDHPIDWS